MAELSLKGIHASCLCLLFHEEQGITQAELMHRCAEDKATISRAIATLQERRLVAGSQQERSKKYRDVLTLTPEGRRIATRVEAKINQALSAVGVRFS